MRLTFVIVLASLASLASVPNGGAALPPSTVTAAGLAEHSWNDAFLLGACEGPAATSVAVSARIMRIHVAGTACGANAMGFTTCEHAADGTVTCVDAGSWVRTAYLRPDGEFRYELQDGPLRQVLHGHLTRLG